MIGNILAGIYGRGPGVGDFESIATVVVGAGNATEINFTAIPGTFQHLQIRAMARNTSGTSDARYQFNGDTGSNYAWHLLVGNGSSANAFNGTSQTSFRGAGYTVYVASSTINGVGITDILDYKDTNKYKTARTLLGSDTNGGGELQYYSGLWMNTAAITSIKITPSTGSFAQYSHFALYGIKG